MHGKEVDGAEHDEDHQEEEEEEGEEEEDDLEGNDLESEDHSSSLRWLREWTSPRKREDGGLRGKLGWSELVPFGQWESFKSGRDFSNRYAHLFEADVNTDYDAQSSDGPASAAGADPADSTAGICERTFGPMLGQDSSFFSSLPYRSCSLVLNIAARHGLTATQEANTSSQKDGEKHRARLFVRASGSDRVVASSRFWLAGFERPRRAFKHAQPETAPWPPQERPSRRSGEHAEAEIGASGLSDQQQTTMRHHHPHRPLRALPHPDLVISEGRDGAGSNNTLDVYTCAAFEAHERGTGQAAERVTRFTEEVTRPARERWAREMGRRKKRRGQEDGRLHLDAHDALNLAALCAFDTVTRIDPDDFSTSTKAQAGAQAHSNNAISPFCSLWEQDEWATVYERSMDISKDYGFGPHQPFHRALGMGWLRELKARMTGQLPVMQPPTSLNTSLVSDPETFPLPPAESESANGRGRDGGKDGHRTKAPVAFVDFVSWTAKNQDCVLHFGPPCMCVSSTDATLTLPNFPQTHDNQLAPVLAALGLSDFGGQDPQDSDSTSSAAAAVAGHGWSTARTTPFAGRLTVEKVSCAAPSPSGNADSDHGSHRYVRLIVNGAVQRAEGQKWCPQARAKAAGDAGAGAGRDREDLCPLEGFLEMLRWTDSGEEWERCYESRS